MVIGFMQVDISIPENRSLKGKRMVLKSIKDQIKNRFNVSVAEIDNHDIWDNSIIGFAIVATDQKYAHKVLNEVIKFIDKFPRTALNDYCMEML